VVEPLPSVRQPAEGAGVQAAALDCGRVFSRACWISQYVLTLAPLTSGLP
jgi:hypothetical protein